MTAQPRWATQRTPERATRSDEVKRIAEELGYTWFPHFATVFDVAMEIEPTGIPAYREVIWSQGRQQGKSAGCTCLMVHRVLSAPNQRVIYSSTTGQAAKDYLWDVFLKRIKDSRFRDLFTVRGSTGHEQIQAANGSVIELAANTDRSKMGTTNHLWVCDEGYAASSQLEQNIRPTLITSATAQTWIVSTAGTPADSEWYHAKLHRGRELVEAGVRSGVATFEWSAPDDAPPGDPATWRACMPALGLTIDESAIAGDFQSFEVSQFARAHLNRWVSAMTDPTVNIVYWNSLSDDASKVESGLVFGIDVSPGRDHASIACAGQRSDGRWHIGIVESRSGNTSWLPGRLRALVTEAHPGGVYVDALSASLVPDIEATGIQVERFNGASHAAAFAYFVEQVTAGGIAHHDDPELVAALTAATTRPLGDGGQAWSKRGSNVPIDGLVACTLALWGAHIRPAPPQIYGPSDYALLATKASLARLEAELAELLAEEEAEAA